MALETDEAKLCVAQELGLGTSDGRKRVGVVSSGPTFASPSLLSQVQTGKKVPPTRQKLQWSVQSWQRQGGRSQATSTIALAKLKRTSKHTV